MCHSADYSKAKERDPISPVTVGAGSGGGRRHPALVGRFSRRRDSLVYSGRPLKTRPLIASVGASGLSFVFIVANAKPRVRPVSPNGENNSTRLLCGGRRRISNKRSHLHEFIDQRQLMHSLSVLTSTQDGLRAVTGCG
jgi:hypothetical protein